MRSKYLLAKGYRLKGVPASVAGAFLEELRKAKGGSLIPQDIVEAARPKASPIHRAFEWNDSEAAEQYRLEQARYLIQAIVVKIVGYEDKKPVRAFVSLIQNDERSYTSTVHAMSDADLRKQVLDTALAEIESWRDRYRAYREFAIIFTAIKRTKKKEARR